MSDAAILLAAFAGGFVSGSLPRWIKKLTAWLRVTRSPQVAELEDLVRHCWVHSGYRDCGFNQMDDKQRALYRRVIGRPEERVLEGEE